MQYISADPVRTTPPIDTPLFDLPLDCLDEIVDYLHNYQLYLVARTCKWVYNALKPHFFVVYSTIEYKLSSLAKHTPPNLLSTDFVTKLINYYYIRDCTNPDVRVLYRGSFNLAVQQLLYYGHYDTYFEVMDNTHILHEVAADNQLAAIVSVLNADMDEKTRDYYFRWAVDMLFMDLEDIDAILQMFQSELTLDQFAILYEKRRVALISF